MFVFRFESFFIVKLVCGKENVGFEFCNFGRFSLTLGHVYIINNNNATLKLFDEQNLKKGKDW